MSGYFKEIPPYYEHQQTTLDLLRQENCVLDLSDIRTCEADS